MQSMLSITTGVTFGGKWQVLPELHGRFIGTIWQAGTAGGGGSTRPNSGGVPQTPRTAAALDFLALNAISAEVLEAARETLLVSDPEPAEQFR